MKRRRRRWTAVVQRCGILVLAGAVCLSTTGAMPSPAAAATTLPSAVGVIGWGSNEFGELGDGTTTNSSTPVRTAGIPDYVKQVASGGGEYLFGLPPGRDISGTFSLALTAGGQVWAWGDNTDGQLGDGTTVGHSTPRQVPGISNAVAISAGGFFALAVLADGTVKAWGRNDVGQLGLPAGGDQLTPVTVPNISGVANVSAGYQHSLALRSDGTVWAWGSDFQGVLGDGQSGPDRFTPQPVSNVTDVRQVLALKTASLALRADGTVLAWGNSCAGLLGNGVANCKYPPTSPVIASISGVTQLGGHDSHVLALRSDGTVWAWGLNVDGDVAVDTTFVHPMPQQVTGLPRNIMRVDGGKVSSLAQDGTGQVWAWGRTDRGPDLSPAPPVQIPGTVGSSGVVAGSEHFLALAPVPAYTIRVARAADLVVTGGSVTTTVSLTAFNGCSCTASLTATGLPTGVTASFSPPTVRDGSPVTLTVHTSASTPNGTFRITITALVAGLVKPTQTATYQVGVGPGYSIALSSTSGSMVAGVSSVATTVSLIPGIGYTGSASLAATNLPAGVTASFSTPGVSANTPVTLTLSSTEASPNGTFTIRVLALDINALFAQQTATYQLTISHAAPSFSLSLSPDEGWIETSGSATTQITLISTDGFTGTATLSIDPEALPAGFTASLSSTQISTDRPVTLTITGTDGPVGGYLVPVTATAPGHDPRNATFGLSITEPPI